MKSSQPITPKHKKTIIDVTIVGADRKGVIADVTNFIFKAGGNIEQVNQNVVRGLFGMHLEASFQKISRPEIDKGLQKLSKKLRMEIKVHYKEPNRLRNVAILVSGEPECLMKILEAKMNGEISCNISVVIGTDDKLRPIADNAQIPFETVIYRERSEEPEKKILQLIEYYDIDLIILARYMRILSPNFVWRYPNRIINIHPSLLPAFPGAYPYVQAYERGAKVMGCTAHFVTEDLDQGPIICQESFKVSPSDTLESIKKKGRALEASTLLEALKLYLAGRLEVYWGRVHILSKQSVPEVQVK